MVTVYESDNRFFMPAGDTAKEIPIEILEEWDKQGEEILITHMEGKD